MKKLTYEERKKAGEVYIKLSNYLKEISTKRYSLEIIHCALEGLLIDLDANIITDAVLKNKNNCVNYYIAQRLNVFEAKLLESIESIDI